MSVLENLIEAPQRVFNVPKEEAKKKAIETLGFLGLESKADNYPLNYQEDKNKELQLEEHLF